MRRLRGGDAPSMSPAATCMGHGLCTHMHTHTVIALHHLAMAMPSCTMRISLTVSRGAHWQGSAVCSLLCVAGSERQGPYAVCRCLPCHTDELTHDCIMYEYCNIRLIRTRTRRGALVSHMVSYIRTRSMVTRMSTRYSVSFLQFEFQVHPYS